MSDRTPTIVGLGLSDYPKAPHLDATGHHVQGMQRALADAGLLKTDIDGYMSAGLEHDHVTNLVEYLGLDPRYLDGTMTGGSSFEFHIQHAAAAIRQGLCETILITYGADTLSRFGRKVGTSGFARKSSHVRGPLQYEAPYGNTIVGAYAMAARRHMHEYGTTPEQLAEIAVGIREHASLNPNALYREPITAEDVLASAMIADPLHLLDCCVISDGGGALIITTAERARDLRQPPVYILGAAGAGRHWNIGQMADFTSCAASDAGPAAFAEAGITHSEVDTLQLYDSYTITVLLLLEGLGFCKSGEGGSFVAEGHLRRGGSLPLNTDGGGLSSCHPGMRGLLLLIEAARQVRGQAGEVQVPECNIAVACGSGGWLSFMGAVVLGREHP